MSNTNFVSSQPNMCVSVEQLWQTVRDNPTDFHSWTLLLQYSEHMKNIESIREAYNGFLSHYPYCYIYWKKFAEYELQLSDERTAFDVLHRAVNAFPISIDIWLHFIQLYIKLNRNQKEIICLFERAIKSCGQDYNSDDLWTLYLNWLSSSRQDLSEVTLLYDRLFRIATKNLSQNFENFSSFVADNNPICIISKNEYNSYCNQYYKINNKIDQTQSKGRDDLSYSVDSKEEESVAKILFIRQMILKERKCIFETTLKESEARKQFEVNIKRPYFHVNPLDRQQLDNWMQYLNWESEHSLPNKVILLFERCLVSCALYEHMWIRYTNYLIDKRYEMIRSGQEFFENFDINTIRDVFRRATQIHLKKSFKIHNQWSLFEEREENFEEALNILDNFQKSHPDLIEAMLSKINLFHRKNDLHSVDSLFKRSIEKFNDCPKLCSHLSIKYSRFLFKVTKNSELAVDVLNRALKVDPNNYVLYLRLIDIEYQKEDMNVTKIEQLFDELIASTVSINVKIAMNRRKLEFMQDFGFSCEKIQKTINRLQNLMHGFDDGFQAISSQNAKRLKVENCE